MSRIKNKLHKRQMGMATFPMDYPIGVAERTSNGVIKNPSSHGGYSKLAFDGVTEKKVISTDSFLSDFSGVTEKVANGKSHYKFNGYSKLVDNGLSDYTFYGSSEVVKSENILGGFTWLSGTYAYWQYTNNDEDYILKIFPKSNVTIPSNLYLGFTNGDYASSGLKTVWLVANGTITSNQNYAKNGMSGVYLKYISVYPIAYKDTISTYFDIMIVKGNNVPTTYTPYFEPYIKNKGVKNLCVLPKNHTIIEQNGLTIVTDSNGNIIVNGTCTQGSFGTSITLDYPMVFNGDCYTTCPIGESNGNFTIYVNRYTVENTILLDGSAEATNGTFKRAYIKGSTNKLSVWINSVANGKTFKSFKITPRVLLGNYTNESQLGYDVPRDNHYYLPLNNTLLDIGTEPLRQGDTYCTDGVRKNVRGTKSIRYIGGWSYVSGKGFYTSWTSSYVKPSTELTCPIYQYSKTTWFGNGYCGVNEVGYMWIYDTSFTSDTELYNAYGDIMLEYDLSTPTTEIGEVYSLESGLVGDRPNLSNEIVEYGYFDTSGNEVSSTAQFRSKNYIGVNPNSSYYISSIQRSGRICFYTSSKTFISRSDLVTIPLTITIPSNCYYIRFHSDVASNGNNDIAIYEGSTSKAYTPHIADETKLQSIQNRGVKNLCYANGKEYVNSKMGISMVDTPNGFHVYGTWAYLSTFSYKLINKLEKGHKYRFQSFTNIPKDRFYFAIYKGGSIYKGYGWSEANSVDLVFDEDGYLEIGYGRGGTDSTVIGNTVDLYIKFNVIDITLGESINTFVPIDSNYYITDLGTPVKIGTEPLREGDWFSTDGVRYSNRASVDMGSLAFNQQTSAGGISSFYARLTDAKVGSKSVVPNYIIVDNGNNEINNLECAFNGSQNIFYLRDDRYSTSSELTNGMSGVMLEYELATPTITVVTVQDVQSGLAKNLFSSIISNRNVGPDGKLIEAEEFYLCIAKVKPNTTYTVSRTYDYYQQFVIGYFVTEPVYNSTTYDSQRVVVSSNDKEKTTFTTPSCIDYIAIRFYKTDTNVMLNEGSTALTYEPFIAQETKRYDVRQFGVKGKWVDLGSFNWYYTEKIADRKVDLFMISGLDHSGAKKSLNFYVTDSYYNKSNIYYYGGADKDCGFIVDKETQFGFRDSRYNDAVDFKKHMSGVMLWYETTDQTADSYVLNGGKPIKVPTDGLSKWDTRTRFGIKKKYGKVNAWELEWLQSSSNNNRFYTYSLIGSIKIFTDENWRTAENTGTTTNHYDVTYYNDFDTNSKNCMCYFQGSNGSALGLFDNKINTISNLKSYLQNNNVVIYYELATATYTYDELEPTTSTEVKDNNTTKTVALQSVNTYELVSLGLKNLWDEEWEIGGINGTNGVNYNSTTDIRSKNYITVNSNKAYYFLHSTVGRIFYYNENKEFIANDYSGYSKAYTTPTNCKYIRFILNGVATYHNDISIYEGTTNHGYLPHGKTFVRVETGTESFYVPIGTDQLRSVGTVVDTRGFDKRITRVGVVKAWEQSLSYVNGRFAISNKISNLKEYGMSETPKILCNLYDTKTYIETNADIIGVTSYSGYIYFKDSNFEDVTTFKAYLQKKQVMIFYKLATPVETAVQPIKVKESE